MSTDMNLEENRMETFEKLLDKSAYFKIDYSITRRLAKHGFYLIGPIQVACIHCNVIFTVQKVLKYTVHMHERFSPECKNLKIMNMEEICSKSSIIDDKNDNKSENENKSGKNEVKLNEQVQENKIKSNEQATNSKHNNESVKNDTQSDKNKNELGENIAEKKLIHHNDPEYPNYKTKQARLKSFKDWPKFIKQRPEELSNAGFFYTGSSDIVTCYSCGHGIRSWEVNDDPWEEHIRWYSYCEHILLNKTEEEIEDILNKRRIYHPSDDEQDEDEQTSCTQGTVVTGDLSFNNRISLMRYGQLIMEEAYNKLCRGNVYKHECMKCKSSESDSVVFPYKHVVTCYNCSRSAKNCFHCGKEIQKVEKLYFA